MVESVACPCGKHRQTLAHIVESYSVYSGGLEIENIHKMRPEVVQCLTKLYLTHMISKYSTLISIVKVSVSSYTNTARAKQ